MNPNHANTILFATHTLKVVNLGDGAAVLDGFVITK